MLHLLKSLYIILLCYLQLDKTKNKEKEKGQDVNGIYLLCAVTSLSILILLDEQQTKDKEEDHDINGLHFTACCN